MMHTMMLVMGPNALFWIVAILLFCLVLLIAIIWLFTTWLKYRKTSDTQYTARPQDSYQGYEQGYQPHQHKTETYEEGDQYYPCSQPQYEQPEVQYPPTMPSQR